MKRKSILLTLVMCLTLFCGLTMKAQIDGYFSYETDQRTERTEGLAFSNFFGGFGQGYGEDNGISFQNFDANPVCAGNGVLMMTVTGVFYLINKRRKENK